MSQDTVRESIDTRNHKGEYCPYKIDWTNQSRHLVLICQEGYCNNCEVFIEWSNKLWGDKEEETSLT